MTLAVNDKQTKQTINATSGNSESKKEGKDQESIQSSTTPDINFIQSFKNM